MGGKKEIKVLLFFFIGVLSVVAILTFLIGPMEGDAWGTKFTSYPNIIIPSVMIFIMTMLLIIDGFLDIKQSDDQKS